MKLDNTRSDYFISSTEAGEECHVTEQALADLHELGAIDVEGRLAPADVLKDISPWQLIMASVGQLHG